ncbi:trichohyalin-like [Engraulis encrasicolus]|uniref:trichohyalin-like n=1 Tax=Engraulis encrasicolus TaxID=184585 RepID=UPI002FCFC6BE
MARRLQSTLQRSDSDLTEESARRQRKEGSDAKPFRHILTEDTQVESACNSSAQSLSTTCRGRNDGLARTHAYRESPDDDPKYDHLPKPPKHHLARSQQKCKRKVRGHQSEGGCNQVSHEQVVGFQEAEGVDTVNHVDMEVEPHSNSDGESTGCWGGFKKTLCCCFRRRATKQRNKQERREEEQKSQEDNYLILKEERLREYVRDQRQRTLNQMRRRRRDMEEVRDERKKAERVVVMRERQKEKRLKNQQQLAKQKMQEDIAVDQLTSEDIEEQRRLLERERSLVLRIESLEERKTFNRSMYSEAQIMELIGRLRRPQHQETYQERLSKLEKIVDVIERGRCQEPWQDTLKLMEQRLEMEEELGAKLCEERWRTMLEEWEERKCKMEEEWQETMRELEREKEKTQQLLKVQQEQHVHTMAEAQAYEEVNKANDGNESMSDNGEKKNEDGMDWCTNLKEENQQKDMLTQLMEQSMLMEHQFEMERESEAKLFEERWRKLEEEWEERKCKIDEERQGELLEAMRELEREKEKTQQLLKLQQEQHVHPMAEAQTYAEETEAENTDNEHETAEWGEKKTHEIKEYVRGRGEDVTKIREAPVGHERAEGDNERDTKQVVDQKRDNMEIRDATLGLLQHSHLEDNHDVACELEALNERAEDFQLNPETEKEQPIQHMADQNELQQNPQAQGDCRNDVTTVKEGNKCTNYAQSTIHAKIKKTEGTLAEAETKKSLKIDDGQETFPIDKSQDTNHAVSFENDGMGLKDSGEDREIDKQQVKGCQPMVGFLEDVDNKNESLSKNGKKESEDWWSEIKRRKENERDKKQAVDQKKDDTDWFTKLREEKQKKTLNEEVNKDIKQAVDQKKDDTDWFTKLREEKQKKTLNEEVNKDIKQAVDQKKDDTDWFTKLREEKQKKKLNEEMNISNTKRAVDQKKDDTDWFTKLKEEKQRKTLNEEYFQPFSE